MKLQDIKAPIIYRAALPSAASVALHLAELPFKEMPVGSHMISASGFVPNQVTGEMVTPIHCGFSFVLRHDEKKIPASQVKKETERRVAAMVANGVPVNRKERLAIKDSVYDELATQAFTETRLIHCFYHEAAGLLFVDASAKLASRTLMLLVRTIGSIKTTTLHISGVKHGLTTRLIGYINGEDTFPGFTVGGAVKLSNPLTGEAASFSTIDPLDCAELKSAVNRDFQVEGMRLVVGDDALAFTLDKDFRFKSLKWAPTDASEGDDDDHAFAWRAHVGAQVLILTETVETLCTMLEHKEPDDGELEPVVGAA